MEGWGAASESVSPATVAGGLRKAGPGHVCAGSGSKGKESFVGGQAARAVRDPKGSF